MDQITEYETIADLYANSMRLPFREVVEQHTLRELVGDISGATTLDMACGDGFYTRWLKRAGASKAIGVDVSAHMIQRAQAEERRDPLGCEYSVSDIAAYTASEPVDVVVAIYSLGYARTGEQLRRFCKACHDALRPGGRFVGLNDNVPNPPPANATWRKYGLERTCASSPSEGDTVHFTVFNADSRQFEVQNFYLKPETYEEAFRAAGFAEFRWVDISLRPSERGNPFWDDFLSHPPIVGFAASK
ncbi:MAG: class I SAM-dependent methyltransferase [Acidobacteria bacterium]|nr:class I SAM-dependent methyltransferase [Acidobacteriota bacterium]MYJ03214.1 class I SAM-dependent methyltransferase [Acidobacteriota bacterium]